LIGRGKKHGSVYTRAADGSWAETKFPVTAEKPAAPAIAKDTQRVADRVLQKLEASPNPALELSSALSKMDGLRGASVTRLGNGFHQVNMHFDHASQMPAINANIRGFRPGPTNVGQDVSFTLSHTQNGVRIDHMQGFSGSVTGPRGRVRPSWSDGMTIGRDQGGTPYVDVDSTVQGPFRMRSSSNRFGEGNFPAGSPMRQLMQHPDVLSDAAGALRLFQNKDDVLQASLRKSADGRFDVAAQSRSVKDIPINQKLEKAGVTINSIHLDSALSGSLSHDSSGAKFGNVKGMTVKMNSLLGETTVTPKSFALQNNADGVPVVRLEVDLKGTVIPIDIPVSKLKEYRNTHR
jgi:hypothetical protein